MRLTLVAAIFLTTIVPASGQERTVPPAGVAIEEQDDTPAPPPPPLRPTQPGRLADSPVGEVGQRITRDRPVAGIEPMARLSNRIANRVQSRIRNRIDRSYDPQANAASPFVNAEEQARAASRPR
jgi:hypothetical protein